ncbi:hypothetical protein HD554DRAFT_2319977 [Boletus coccyginus]|nr:hypothetical protein HD554DRAFT_2319977 [Boletus coccyginus]
MSPAQSSSVMLPAHDAGPFPTRSQTSSDSALVTLKRRVAALEVENTQLLSKIVKRPVHSLSREGRAVRRVVTLVEPISDMIGEHDRRQLRLSEGASMEMIQAESTNDQERTNENFKKLVQWCPSIVKLLDAGQFDLCACREVQAGADSARGDDASTLKGEVIHWITANRERMHPPLYPRDKRGRGLSHHLTGGLLCPVDYDWADSSVRTSIQEYHPDFRVTAFSWPRFLYKAKCTIRMNPPRSFKCIFTSPSSARDHGGEEDPTHFRGLSSRSRSHVAALLRMKSVQPRAIAYIAVQVRFALSSADSWTLVDEDFNYETFYYNIIDYFEAPGSPPALVEQVSTTCQDV